MADCEREAVDRTAIDDNRPAGGENLPCGHFDDVPAARREWYREMVRTRGE